MTIVRFLLSIERPSAEVIASIEAAVEWLRAVPIHGARVDRIRIQDGKPDRIWVKDASAPLLWARFYELKTNRPHYLDRDSVFRYNFSEIGYERRNGYSYLGTWPAGLLEKDYPQWLSRK